MRRSIQHVCVRFPKCKTLADILYEANATGRYWIGASDLEEVGHFKWFYSGKTIPRIHWDDKGKPDNKEEALKLDQVRMIYKLVRIFFRNLT